MPRFCDEPGVAQIYPALLIAFPPLPAPVADYDVAATLNDGYFRPERADRDIANAAEHLRAIGRCRYNGPVEAGDIRGVVRDRPGEPGPAICPVDRQQVARQQLDLTM